MGFLADGPQLPDELLVARDEGRVLFFCGAGVSRAKASLPDFLGLAKSVLRELRALPESPAQKLVDAAERLDPIAGVGGILAADRIFGLLEREFSVTDIERAVGAALKPHDKVDLSAHRTLLALSRDGRGKVQLVTTNFDRLFEVAGPRVPLWTQDRLPDLRGTGGFEGIVHLHGMFEPAYDKPVGGRLVLSSAEFGRAYLAEGWATDFIRAVIRRYLIVFVGYAADDPPVQYLLEALNRVADIPPHGLYAFQAGREEDAKALWTQKGVRAIAYAPDNGHAALWETLNAWVGRVRDPERWRKRLIRRARKGPQVLQPYERGQIVHLAGTEDGARTISQTKQVLPANWLCVFDPATRYGQPGKAKPLRADSLNVDPFSHYSIDSDPPPPPANENQLSHRREIPAGVVDVLAPGRFDQQTMGGCFRGRGALHASELSPRLVSLAAWLHRVCGEPAAIWWASGQAGLHPTVIHAINFAVNHKEPALPPLARIAWRYLFESWGAALLPDRLSAFDLKDEIARDGWTKSHIRRFAKIYRCSLMTSRPFWAGPLPPIRPKWPRLRDLVDIDVHYPERQVNFAIPNEQLLSIIPLLRQNLEYAVDLQREVNPAGLPHIPPIEPDPHVAGTSADRDFGISPHVLDFADLFRRLVQHDKSAALFELAAWRRHDDPVFERLRIWAAGLDNLLDGTAAGEILRDADDKIFWGSRDQRDLLLSLRRKWQSMPADIRATIEKRLLAGPSIVRNLSAAWNRQYRSVAILNRVTWLRDQSCAFAANVEAALARLGKVVPQWTPTEAARAVDSQEARGGTVRTDTSFGDLENVPISDLIPRAMQGQKRVWGESQEYDPFAGLCEKRPVRVLAGLRYELRNGANVALAWSQFLYSAGRQTDNPRVAALIARRLAALPQPALDAIVTPASYWLESLHRRLCERDQAAFQTVFDKLANTVAESPASAQPEPSPPGDTRDWSNLSLHSAAGRLAHVLFGDPVLAQLKPKDGLPDAWLARAERLLALPGDHARFSLVHFAQLLGWLHNRAPAWSEQHIVGPILQDGANRDAALAGFLLNPQVGNTRLYVLLKPLLIELATIDFHSRRHDTRALSVLFVSGWLIYGGDRLRTHVLWRIERFEDFAEKITFLRKVWPPQTAVRTPTVIGRLCTLAFDDEPHFRELVSAILPLVSRADGGSLTLPLVRSNDEAITKNYPDQVLELLAAVLPEDVTRWPYGVEQTLQRVAQVKPTLVTDPEMVRLKGIWDRR